MWCQEVGKNNYFISFLLKNGEIEGEYYLQHSIKNKKTINVDLLRDMKF